MRLLLCFACFRSRAHSSPPSPEDDSTSVFEVPKFPAVRPRRPAEHPPPLSSTATNLFDTFPRVVYGGYRRYYESSCEKQEYRAKSASKRRSDLFEPPVMDDPWSWQTLPTFTGTRRRVRRTNSPQLIRGHRLRKKPRFGPSAMPLVDTTYPWPEWVAEFNTPKSATREDKVGTQSFLQTCTTH